jgi:hypothetical protein
MRGQLHDRDYKSNKTYNMPGTNMDGASQEPTNYEVKPLDFHLRQQTSHSLQNTNGNKLQKEIPETKGSTKFNGWNGTHVKASDPYALMRDCNANSR